MILMSGGQEWQFHNETDVCLSRMTISHCYSHLEVRNGNLKWLLTSGGQEWQFHIATGV